MPFFSAKKPTGVINDLPVFCSKNKGINFSELPNRQYNGALNEKVSVVAIHRRPSNASLVTGVVVISKYPREYCWPTLSATYI